MTVVNALIAQLEADLGRHHTVLSQGEQATEHLFDTDSPRKVLTVPIDDGLQGALETLRIAVDGGDPLMLLPSWEHAKGFKSSPMAKTIGMVHRAFKQQPLTVIVPATILQSRSSRDRHEAFTSPPSVVVVFEHLGAHLGVHPSFVFALVHLRPGQETTKFFKVTGPSIETESVVRDFKMLLSRGGGQTKYGFVRRQRIPLDQPLWPDYWSPILETKLQDVRSVGATAPLGDLADVLILVNRTRMAHAIGTGVPLFSGRTISPDGQLDFDSAMRMNVDSELCLRAGDVLVRAIQDLDRRPLITAQVGEDQLPATADHTVLVVRPHPDLDPMQSQFLHSFLASPTARMVLRSRGPRTNLSIADLAELPVPIPDEATRSALAQLHGLRAKLEGWAHEASSSVDDLMSFSAQRTAAARTRLFAVNSVLQRRVDAAGLTESLPWQVRNLYPHPIAYCVRTVDASRPDFEGYRTIIRCAEMTLSYLAFAAITVSLSDPTLEIPYMSVLRQRVRQQGVLGLSLGDYTQIVRQFSQGPSQRPEDHDDWTPLEEIRSEYTAAVDHAVTAIKNRRNSAMHFRDEADLEEAYRAAREELFVVLDALRFLTDYPLLLVEDVRLDTLAGSSWYTYRELTGDHALVPLQSEQSHQPQLEVGSLYIRDRQGILHLMRPFVVWSTCPTCGRAGTFHLDTYGVSMAQYRSFEHGHTLDDLHQLPALMALGLTHPA